MQKDMVAVRMTPDVQMTIVGSPRYFETHRVPETNAAPGAPQLRDGDRETEVRVIGQVTFNGAYQMLNAALSGRNSSQAMQVVIEAIRYRG